MPNFEQIEAVVKLIESPNLTATSTLIKNKIAQVKNREILIKNN